MKIGKVLGITLLLLCGAPPAASAGPEIYLLGGLALANLTADADQIGDEVALQLDSEVGGAWSSSKRKRTGFEIGGGVGLASAAAVGAAIELRYATRGAKWNLTDQSGTYPTVTMTAKLSYVEIAALLKVKPPASGSVHAVFLIGPSVGIKAASDLELKTLGQSSSVEMEGMKSAYVGGVIGAGIEVAVTPVSSLLLQARFQPGITNLVDDSTFTLKSSAFSLLAGWSFGI